MSETPVAIVTGAGTGIGSAVARGLADEGFRIGVHYRSSEAGAREVADKLPDAFLLKGDIAETAQIDEMVKTIKEEAGRVDVLVNNAGYNVNGLTPAMKVEDYDAVAAIERGTWYLTKLVLRRFMLRQKSGRIINITSVVGHTGNPGQVPYTMVKAGIDAMTRSLSQEMAGRTILVNSVAPGFIDTDMTEELPEEIRQGILERIPLGRMGAAEEVADAVSWLATRASYVNGSVIHVNGGMYGG